MNTFFTVWTFIRLSGLLGFYLLTLSLIFGLLSSLSFMKKRKILLTTLHQTSGWYGLLTVIFHIILIWRDQYVPYSLAEIFLPFSAQNKPVLSALGTLSFYLFFIVIGSSDFFMKRLGIKNWKRIHLTVIPAWVLMTVHSLLIGTDSSRAWALFLYGSTGSLIVILLILRLTESVLLKQSSISIKRNQHKNG